MFRLTAGIITALFWGAMNCGLAFANDFIAQHAPPADISYISKALSEAKNGGDYLFFSIGPGDGSVAGSMQYVLITSDDKISCSYVIKHFEEEPVSYQVINKLPKVSTGAFENFNNQLSMAGIQQSNPVISVDIESTYKGISQTFNVDYVDLLIPGATMTDLQRLTFVHRPECWDLLF